MAAHPMMSPMRSLYGQPAVAEPIQPSKLLSYRRIDGAINALINDRGTLRLLRTETTDHPELLRLGDCDRARLQGALAAISNQEAGNAA